MIIGVDAGVLGGTSKNLQAGVYISACNLFQQLKKLDRKNTYLFYSFLPIDKKLLATFPAKSKNILLPSKGWLYLSMPLAFLREKPDVFLAISQAMPVYHPFKTIGFVHGLDFTQKFHQERTEKMKKNTRFMITNATELITTSHFLKEEIAKKYKKKDTHIVSLGVSKTFSKKVLPHREKNPYFLFVGTLKVSKNIPSILKSFAFLQKKNKKNYSLLVVGSNFWLDPEIQRTIRKLKLENYIKLISPVSQENLASYYKGAVALVSPSLYEGFGLPVVEAMMVGCPVIASNIGAIPEVVNNAALLSDPLDIKKIAEHMEILATNKKLRTTLIKRGKYQAKKYSWEKFARQILDIIKSI